MDGVVWKGVRNSIWRCRREWGGRIQVTLEVSLGGDLVEALAINMGPDATWLAQRRELLPQTTDASRVQASARLWECCKVYVGTKDEKARWYERPGIVSYSVGKKAIRVGAVDMWPSRHTRPAGNFAQPGIPKHSSVDD